MAVPGFERLIDAPASLLGKHILLLHWAGATECATLKDVDEAKTAFLRGWTRYQIVDEQ